jgi:hypothetical protein
MVYLRITYPLQNITPEYTSKKIHHNPELERTPSLSLSDLTISLPPLQHTQIQRYSALLWSLYPSRWYQDRVPRHHGSSPISCLEDATCCQVWTCSVVLHCLCCDVLWCVIYSFTDTQKQQSSQPSSIFLTSPLTSFSPSVSDAPPLNLQFMLLETLFQQLLQVWYTIR